MKKASANSKEKARKAFLLTLLKEKKGEKHFSRVAKNFSAQATTSKESAQAALVAIGIHTQDGKLTKKYR